MRPMTWPSGNMCRNLKRGLRFAAIWVLMLVCLFLCGGWMELGRLKMEAAVFEESARPLHNPNRGFYRLYAFQITDSAVDYAAQVDSLYSQDQDTTLALIEINLLEYRAGEISRAGLENIDALFRALSNGGKRLIVRFLYDWESNNLHTEPEELDVILRHMEQLKDILRRYSDDIFILQGLFIGDWGEMHHTRYESAQDLRRLAQKLAEASGAYLAVRTPAQWRLATQDGADAALAVRLGLFNDGILGSETDLGTYDMASQGDQRRSRTEELAFQEELCRSVPNGGEVVVENPLNDFEAAVRDLSAMHVTYLNQGYDPAVMEKWADTVVSQDGCFDGMDGLSYMERHLGYRLLIGGVTMERRAFRQQALVEASFRNEGFAPLYLEPELTLSLRGTDGGLAGEYPAAHNLCGLAGGAEAEKSQTVQWVIPTEGLAAGHYEVYLRLEDPVSGQEILLANSQDSGPYGYCLGEIEVCR